MRLTERLKAVFPYKKCDDRASRDEPIFSKQAEYASLRWAAPNHSLEQRSRTHAPAAATPATALRHYAGPAPPSQASIQQGFWHCSFVAFLAADRYRHEGKREKQCSFEAMP